MNRDELKVFDPDEERPPTAAEQAADTLGTLMAVTLLGAGAIGSLAVLAMACKWLKSVLVG
jgi:hypothetical protein